MLSLCLLLILGLSLSAYCAPQVSPSVEADAEYLLTTTDFMDSQFGMEVRDVEAGADALTVRTTGAEFVFQPSTDTLELRQLLGMARTAATVQFPDGALKGLAVTRQGSGAVLLNASEGALEMRINGDSLLMLRIKNEATVSYALGFEPLSVRQYMGNSLLLDEYGGVGSYVATNPRPVRSVTSELSVVHHLSAGQVLWVSVAPPKPFDWEASFNDRVVWHWSRQTGYPSDANIDDWSKHANILLQQAEVMLWKDWGLRFIPRNGIDEFERVNTTCEKNGMRNIVYTSPYYFLASTEYEGEVMNTFEDFKGFHRGDGRGLNWPIFLEEIRKVVREYKPDGLYFDGIYDNVVRTYLISRKAREVVGDEGILEYHATGSPPGGGVYVPQIDAYFNFILRGEGRQQSYESDDYLRYFVSTYNISNAIGVLCNNNNYPLTEEFLNGLLDKNIRLHLIPGWLSDERGPALDAHYWPALTDSLKERVAKASTQRQEAGKAARAMLRAAVEKGTEGLREVYLEDFATDGDWAKAPQRAERLAKDAPPTISDAPGGWQATLSPNSEATMSCVDGRLEITSREHSYAYLERPLPDNVVAVQCKIRGVESFGQSWGPGLLLWAGTARHRIGLRTDDRAQIDRADGQLLFEGFHHNVWTWLRLRIVEGYMIYEAATDGRQWRLLRAEEMGELKGEKRLVVGMVPFNGENMEYDELGPRGLCYFDDVRVFVAGEEGP